jgi:hypothetical protein
VRIAATGAGGVRRDTPARRHPPVCAAIENRAADGNLCFHSVASPGTSRHSSGNRSSVHLHLGRRAARVDPHRISLLANGELARGLNRQNQKLSFTANAVIFDAGIRRAALYFGASKALREALPSIRRARVAIVRR